MPQARRWWTTRRRSHAIALLFVIPALMNFAVVRSAIFAPVVSSIVVVSVIWALMYHVQLGLINSIITSAGLPRIAFLSNADLALVAIVIMMVWKEIGFSLIILMAGLKGIPDMF